MANFIWDNIFKTTGKDQTIRKALRENILFKDLNLRELLMLEKIVNVRQYRQGEMIFNQGEVGVGMYLIVSGAVDIYVEKIKTTKGHTEVAEPEQTFITQLTDNAFFGELALVEQEGRRTALAIAHKETTLIGFFKPDLVEVVERNPSAGVKILLRLGEVLGNRLHQTTSRITELQQGLAK